MSTQKHARTHKHTKQSFQRKYVNRTKPQHYVLLLDTRCGCETWSLTLREERGQTVFKNRVLRRIFGPTRDGVTGEWGKPHNDLYCSLIIVQVIKSRRMRWSGHVARMGERRVQSFGGKT
jgi:hypothetical protein